MPLKGAWSAARLAGYQPNIRMAVAVKDRMKEKEDTQEDSAFKKLLNEFGAVVRMPKVGEVVKGKVLSTSRNEVRLDLDGIAVGVVRGEELFKESRDFADLKAGDEIEATVIEQENERGEVELSFRLAGHRRAWDGASALLQEGALLDVQITGANQGGLLSRVGSLEAFMPVSQLAPDNYPRVGGGDKRKILEKLRVFQGKTMKVKVIDVNEREGKVIISERAVWEEGKRALLSSYKVGQEVEGAITSLAPFGAFVKFGSAAEEVEGLIHISEIAWERIALPSDILKVGEAVRAQIISIDGPKIFLSVKRLKDNPWVKFAEETKPGSVMSGTVTKVAPYGLVVQLTPAIHGLAHVSELSDGGNVPADKVGKEGETREFEVLSVDPAGQRLALRLKGVKKEGKSETGKVSIPAGDLPKGDEISKTSNASEVEPIENLKS